MTRARASSASLVAILLAVALVACAPEEPPRPAAADPAVSTPTPTPTPEQPSTPQPVLALGCLELLTLANVRGFVTEPITLRSDEATPPTDVWQAALRQAGGMRCVWAGHDRTDAGFDDGLEMVIVPATIEEFRAAQAVNPYGQPMTFGEEAGLWCDSVYAQCRANVFVDGFWIEAIFSDSGRTGDGAPLSAETAIRASLGTALAAIGARPADRPLWEPPARGGTVCAPASAQAIGAALGTDATGFEVVPLAATISGPAAAAAARAGADECDWPDAFIRRLPGGAWAAPTIADGVVDYLMMDPQPTTLPGVGPVVTALGDGCLAWFAHDGDLIEMWTGCDGQDEAAAHAGILEQVQAVHPLLG